MISVENGIVFIARHPNVPQKILRLRKIREDVGSATETAAPLLKVLLLFDHKVFVQAECEFRTELAELSFVGFLVARLEGIEVFHDETWLFRRGGGGRCTGSTTASR